jgi:hypothetical protein
MELHERENLVRMALAGEMPLWKLEEHFDLLDNMSFRADAVANHRPRVCRPAAPRLAGTAS